VAAAIAASLTAALQPSNVGEGVPPAPRLVACPPYTPYPEVIGSAGLPSATRDASNPTMADCLGPPLPES
jgi:hypothetical protein